MKQVGYLDVSISVRALHLLNKKTTVTDIIVKINSNIKISVYVLLQQI